MINALNVFRFLYVHICLNKPVYIIMLVLLIYSFLRFFIVHKMYASCVMWGLRVHVYGCAINVYFHFLLSKFFKESESVRNNITFAPIFDRSPHVHTLYPYAPINKGFVLNNFLITPQFMYCFKCIIIIFVNFFKIK